MAAKLTRLTHEIAIRLQLVAESCTICCSRSRRPVRKLLDIPSYVIYESFVLWALFEEIYKILWPLVPNIIYRCAVVSVVSSLVLGLFNDPFPTTKVM